MLLQDIFHHKAEFFLSFLSLIINYSNYLVSTLLLGKYLYESMSFFNFIQVLIIKAIVYSFNYQS